MKQTKILTAALALGLAAPLAMMAQQDEKPRKNDPVVVEGKKMKDPKETETIVITRTGNTDGKTIIEINGEKITVNGKPVSDKDENITVNRMKYKDMEGLSTTIAGRPLNNQARMRALSYMDENRAMLGVSTESAEGGVEVQDVTEGSAAEKAGIKEEDIITKIDDKSIANPDELSAAIKAHKPGEKVTVTYLRDKKEQKVTAELTKWKGMGETVNIYGPGNIMNMDLGDMNLRELSVPRVSMPRGVQGQPFGEFAPGQSFGWSWNGSGPKLGLSVQDNDDGKGVKVIDVDEDSNAGKAGVKEDDLITEVNGKAVNGADEMAKIVKENKDKVSIQLKIQRDGKTQNIEVKMPRKLKSADL